MKKALVSICVISLALLSVKAAGAETLSGHIEAAMDSKPVQEARVVLVDREGENIATVTTNESGKYFITGLAPGTYRITVFSPMRGEKIAEKDIPVQSGRSVVKNFKVGPCKSLWGQAMKCEVM